MTLRRLAEVGPGLRPPGLLPPRVVVGAGVPHVVNRRAERRLPRAVADDRVDRAVFLRDLEPGDHPRRDGGTRARFDARGRVAGAGDHRSARVRLVQCRLERDAGAVDTCGADRGDRARLEPVAAVARIDVDRAADVVAVHAAQLHDRVARSGRRGERPAALELALPPGVRGRAAGRGVGDGAGDQRRSVPELDAERVRAGTDEARDVVGAVLRGQLVVRVARSEDLIAHAPAVELGFVDADAREVQPRLGDLRATPPVDRERARKDRQRVAQAPPGVLDPPGRTPVAALQKAHLPRGGATPPRDVAARAPDPTCQTTACRT